MTLGMDYLLIGCSNHKPGEGWTQLCCSQPEFRGWLNVQVDFERCFAMYHQGQKIVKDVRQSDATARRSANTKKSDNASDKEKKKLGHLLNESLSKSNSKIQDTFICVNFVLKHLIYSTSPRYSPPEGLSEDF